MSYMIYVHASFLERLTRFRSKLIVSFLMIHPCLPASLSSALSRSSEQTLGQTS